MNAIDLERFSKHVLMASGADSEEAAVVAEVLVWCDSVGRHNQGVWRLPVLCERIEKKLYTTPCSLNVTMKSQTIGVVDARAGLGHYVAYKVMQQAILIAKAEGISMLTAKNSNFYGAGGYYAWMAANENLIGIAMSNSFPKVRAFNGKDPVLGTNPLAFACPAIKDEPLILDMATSALAGSTVRKQQENGESEKTKKSSSALNLSAQPSVIDPFGDSKGYGLALMVEILSGVLSGSGFSHQVKSMYENYDEPGNNGHFFLVIDINKIMPLSVFCQRMSTLIEWLKNSGKNSGDVKYPGQNRWQSLKSSRANGIQLDETTQAELKTLAKRLNVEYF